jgi:anti-sigma regulatory factor (Ser/Thr protein kinase)
MTAHRVITIDDASQPAAARAAARELAAAAGFGETDSYRAGLVATELATNLAKHASGGGELLCRQTHQDAGAELELLSIDRGPGIRDVAAALVDGHSTAGSPGTGLGAIQRLADVFDIHSQEGRGTVVLARLRAGRVPATPTRTRLDISAISVAKRGEEVCGDAWAYHYRADGAVAMVADGLGHGPAAAEAAVTALASFTPQAFSGTARTVEEMHAAIRHTRGAAAAVAEILPDAQLVKFTGVGNVAATICHNGTLRQAVSHNGTLGHQAHYFREYSYAWPSGSWMVLYSDGLTSHWALNEYRGLVQRHPAVIAAVLYRDFSRQRDDVTVMVCKEMA